jgi:hypothetical protein
MFAGKKYNPQDINRTCINFVCQAAVLLTVLHDWNVVWCTVSNLQHKMPSHIISFNVSLAYKIGGNIDRFNVHFR